jgi:hypothetical protein
MTSKGKHNCRNLAEKLAVKETSGRRGDTQNKKDITY